MAELFCWRFADFSHRKAFQAEEHDAFTCGRKPLREYSSCGLQKNLRNVHISHLERLHGYGASFLRLVSPAYAPTCCYSLTLVVCNEEEAFAHVGAHPNGSLLHHNGLRPSNIQMEGTALVMSSATDNSRYAISSMPSTEVDVVDDMLHLHEPPAHMRASHGNDGSIDGTHDPQSMRLSLENDVSVDGMHNTTRNVPEMQRDTLLDDLASLQNDGKAVLSDSQRGSRNLDDMLHLHKPPAHMRASHGNVGSIDGTYDPQSMRVSLENDASVDGMHNTTRNVPEMQRDTLPDDLASLQNDGKAVLSDSQRGSRNVDDMLHLHEPPAHMRASHGNDGSIDGTHDPQFMRVSLETDASGDGMHNTTRNVPEMQRDTLPDDLASLQNDGKAVLSDSQRGSRNAAPTSPSGLVSALEVADMSGAGDIFSSVAPFRVSDFNLIVRSLKPSAKIAELSHWMNSNCTTLDVHTMVFRELVKRREWTMLDNLLTEEVKACSAETLCKVFNKVFHICGTEGAPTWASKWFHFMIQEGVQPDSTTFRLLAPLFQRYEMYEDAKFVYQHMHSVGVECPIASLAILKLYLCACQFEKAKQIYNKTWAANQEPWIDLLTSQLTAFVRNEKVIKAEEIMKYMLESGESLGISDYNLMITVNGKAGEYIRAREWFFRIEKDGLQPNEATYRSIIGACGRAGNLYDALSFYNKMVSSHFSPSLVNYNTLIHLHRKVDNHGRILTILSDMKSAQCCPNSSTLNSVLKVYERYGRLKKMTEALNLLREAGWMPNAICHGFLIRAYIRCNMVKQAMEIFDKLCAGGEFQEIMCHNLICMCKSVGCYDEAIYVYHEMCRLGKSKPCLRTSCAVIDVYSLKGAVEEGEALYKELRLERDLDAPTYNVVLSMFLKAGLLEKAAGVLKEVLQGELLQPDLYLFLCMLKVCVKCSLQDKAVEIYRRIVKSKVSWTDSLYTGVLHTCGRALPTEDVLALLNAMVSARIPINNVTCNLLMDIFGKAGLLDKAEYVLRLAQKQGVQDGISFSTIIDAYGKASRFEEMESIFIEMLNEGFKACAEAYNAMLDAYGNAGQIRKMENTLERMRIAGCVPNLMTYNTLLKVYGQEGLFRDVQIVLKRIEAAGLKLDSYSFTTLIHAYGHVDMLDESLKWFQEMQKAGFEPGLITYSCLISVLRNAGYRQEAARLSSWIKAEGFR